MTRTIYKYEVPIDDQDHAVPIPVIHVGVQTHNSITVWSEVDTTQAESDRPKELHRVFGTGHILPDGAIHAGSVITIPFVWHLYNTQHAED